ncbi:MAG: TIGR04283 family arsenosugar biosynthesis glycosyltransferase [Elainellaceae cyanobacterium]
MAGSFSDSSAQRSEQGSEQRSEQRSEQQAEQGADGRHSCEASRDVSHETGSVSIIIPMLNEATVLARTLRNVGALCPAPQEVILVDGGSGDETMAIANRACSTALKAIPTQVLTTATCGRGIQMNRGAKAATGEVLCFLHADTLVPDDLLSVIEATLGDRRCVGGGFVSLMAGQTHIRWGVTLHNVLKTYYAPLLFRPHQFFRGLRILFGDQAIFCRRRPFWICGGFDESLPLMEDADLCCRLYRQGKLRLVNRTVQVSDRRVAKLGTIKANWLYFSIGFLWGLGVSAAYLKQFYDDIR